MPRWQGWSHGPDQAWCSIEIEVLNDGARMADWGNLTEEEIQILQCWYDAGYPEN